MMFWVPWGSLLAFVRGPAMVVSRTRKWELATDLPAAMKVRIRTIQSLRMPAANL